ncbi:UNVERIFIED_CONTAM: type IV pilus assembly protein PilA [Acetivibrio alkalicellulosi]
MKKMLKNQKGFSLIELLIVIAIMGVLAAIAFSMFSGVFSNTQRRADERTADQIAKAIAAYMVDTNDGDLTKLVDSDTTYEAQGSAATPTATLTDDATGVQNLIELLQHTIVIVNSAGREVKYGPYLVPKEGETPNWEHFQPVWNGHEDNGYHIEIYSDLQKADVIPVPKDNPPTDIEVGIKGL